MTIGLHEDAEGVEMRIGGMDTGENVTVAGICPEGERAGGRPRYAYCAHCDDCVCDGPLTDTGGHDTTPGAARGASVGLWDRRVK